jgi:RNA polymerase sigma factor (sigma-70 family)
MQQRKQALGQGRQRSAIAGDSGGEEHSTAGVPQFDPNDPVEPAQMERVARKSEAAAESALARKSVELVGRIRAGDGSVWRDISDQYEPLLRWIARQCRLSPEDTDDVVQLTWIRCLEHIDQLADPGRLGGWLTTTCRRECIRLATKRRREVPLSGPDLARLIDAAHDDGDPYVKVEVRDQHNRLYHAISALPERQKMLLIELLRQEDQSYLDLSRSLGLPVGSIGPTLQRAVTRLRLDPRLADLPSDVSDVHLQARSA